MHRIDHSYYDEDRDYNKDRERNEQESGDVCPRCGAPAFWVGSTLVCTVCGLTLEESPIDMGPEWRAYSPEDRRNKARTGPFPTKLLHNNGYGSIVGASKKNIRQWKLVVLQSRLRSHGNERSIEILQETRYAVSLLGLPKHVAETMAVIMRKLHYMRLIKKNNLSEYIAAAAIIASRIERYPLSMKDTAQKLRVNTQALWRAYTSIHRKLKVRTTSIPRPSMYISKIASKLNLAGEVETLAYRISRFLVSTGIAQGKPPEALAAASVYVASILLDQKRNQMFIAKAINVTDATIRNRYRDIVDNFYIEVRL